MTPTDPVDDTHEDRIEDRAPVRLSQALPEVLDHLHRHRRTTGAAAADPDPAHPRRSPAGHAPGRPHRIHRTSTPAP